jgi:23S rRNA (adenine2030-N6)-methyltransferase
LHGQDAATLKAAFRHQRQASVHERDGYAALTAFLPPPERRALILIDPPYERDDEFARLTTSLATAYARFPSGVFAAWFPIKHRAPIRDYFAALKLTQIRDVTTATFWLREPVDPTRLNGCGLIIINPPFGFEAAALPMLRALADSLGEAGAGCAYERLIDE